MVVTPPTLNRRLQRRLLNLAIEPSWLFPLQVFHYLPRTALWLIPRQTDCPGSFHSAQPMRTRATKFFGSLRPTYCEVFTQPQKLQPCSNFWLERPNFNFQGTDQFMPFALFTTLLETCSFESRQPLAGRYTNTIITTNNQQEIFGVHLLILVALNPVKLTWSSPCIPRQIKNYDVGLIAPPDPLKRNKTCRRHKSDFQPA
jgi:hypothetical protein